MMKLSQYVIAAVMLFMPCVAHAHLKLSDFEGNYVSYSYSIGGVTGTTGLSLCSIAQLSIDKHGNGKINFLSASTYTGPIGAPLITVSTPGRTAPKLKFKITVTNPGHNGGTIDTFNSPNPGSSVHSDFVAIKKHGKVVEFYENILANPGAAIGAASLVFTKRQ